MIGTEEIKHTLALTLVPGIGPAKAKGLIAHCGSAKAVFEESEAALMRIPEIGPSTASAIKSADVFERANEEMQFVEKYNINVLSLFDENYPDRLKQCIDAPLLLFVKGHVNLNAAKTISVVGTRSATPYGRAFCDEFIAAIKSYSPLIISGLAYGIDIAAHKAAIHNSLPTIGCLAHGLDRIYPPAHTSVAEQMIRNGALVTEFISGTNPDRELFPTRNRIIAGLSDAVIVVETDKRGGSIITAHLANGYSREVFAVPGRINDLHSSGCNDLIKKNVAAILPSPEDFIEYLGWNQSTTSVPKQLNIFHELNDGESKVISVIQASSKIHFDSLFNALDLSPASLSSTLLALEFKGLIRALPGKQFECSH
jgi:DNA processing protein